MPKKLTPGGSFNLFSNLSNTKMRGGGLGQLWGYPLQTGPGRGTTLALDRTYPFSSLLPTYMVGINYFYCKQGSLPAWTQEAYCPLCIKYSTCCPIPGGTPNLATGVPIPWWGYPIPGQGNTPSQAPPVLTWLGEPHPWTGRKGSGTSHWGTPWKGTWDQWKYYGMEMG